VTSVVPSDDKNSVKVSLTFLHLMGTFSEFWDIFTTSAHEQDIPNFTKFRYLKSSLCAAAAFAISGISVTNDNYKLAIDILKDKFGKREEALYS